MKSPNVIWDLCGFEDFEKRGQWAQESEIRVIWPLENLKLLYDEGGGFFVGFCTKFRWPLARANVKFEECIYRSLYICFAFCLFVHLFSVTPLQNRETQHVNIVLQCMYQFFEQPDMKGNYAWIEWQAFKCYHVFNWFILPKPGFLKFIWIFSGINHLKINISYILNSNLTK
jgi:hypothetical protein